MAEADTGLVPTDDTGTPPTQTPPTQTPPCEDDACGTLWTGEVWQTCAPCRDGAELDEAMAPVDEVLDRYFSESYMPDIIALDRADIRAHAEEAFRQEPDLDRATVTGLNRVVQAFANGHSGLLPTAMPCSELGGAQPHQSLYEACAVPLEDGFVVTRASATLGLEPGDQVVAVNGLEGDALVDWIVDGPLCATGAGTRSTAQALASASLFAGLQEGDVLTVEDPAGAIVDVPVPEPGVASWCGTDAPSWIGGHQRADGVAVIEISRFILYPSEPGYVPLVDQASVDAFQAAMLGQARVVFEAVTPGAVGVVWDICGNGGGLTTVGLALAAGTPGATPGLVASCVTRIPDSDPIGYYPFALDLELPVEPRFAVTGPVAVLTDGHAVSASDYFAHAMQAHTEARLFGTPTFGAYGGSALATPLASAPHLALGIDTARCDDPSGVPLETRSVQPDEWLEPTPDDLAAGRDTVLEAATAWVLATAAAP